MISLKYTKPKNCSIGKVRKLITKKVDNTLNKEYKLFLRNRILCHENDTQEIDHPDRNTRQLVLPKSFRTQALKGCHDDLGHLGVERTLDLLRD